MKRTIIIALLLSACTDEAATVSTLQRSGFTGIRTTGYAAFSCSEDDVFATGFSAINPLGQRVSGVVCCGTFKSCTVRF